MMVIMVVVRMVEMMVVVMMIGMMVMILILTMLMVMVRMVIALMLLMTIKDDENDSNNDNNKNNQEVQCLLYRHLPEPGTYLSGIPPLRPHIFQNGRCQDLPRVREFPETEQPGEMSLVHRHQSIPEVKQTVETPETFSVFLPASLRFFL